MLEQILQDIQALRKLDKKILVVFDLDSTLFDVSPRLERILADFSQMPINKKKFPQETEALKKAHVLSTDWGIEASLKRAGLDSAPASFHEAIHTYWRESFFSNHYLRFDDVYSGAVEFVQTLDQMNCEISYLTGRDEARMGPGSFEVLKLWNFPLHKTAELVLKPHKSMDDAQFKTDYFIEKDKDNYDQIYFFENEPVNLHHLSNFCPHIKMVFFESTHSGKAQCPPAIPSISHFLTKKEAR